MSFVTAHSDDAGVVLVEYRPAYGYRYGESEEYRARVQACVIVQIGVHGTVYLSMDDVETLLSALPEILARHQDIDSPPATGMAA